MDLNTKHHKSGTVYTDNQMKRDTMLPSAGVEHELAQGHKQPRNLFSIHSQN